MTLADLKPGDLFELGDEDLYLLLNNKDKVQALCVNTADWTSHLIDRTMDVQRISSFREATGL